MLAEVKKDILKSSKTIIFMQAKVMPLEATASEGFY
jgi:hypothetical protein